MDAKTSLDTACSQPAWTAGLRLLVFDLDGTLIDSAGDIIDSANAALRELGRAALPGEVIAGYIGNGAPVLMERVLARSNGQPADDAAASAALRGSAVYQRALASFLSIYDRNKLARTRLYEGVEPGLQRLERKYTLAVLTNKPERMSREILTGLGIADLLARIYGGDSFATKKPDPEGLLRLLEELGIRPEEALMVGDSAVDIRAGKNAGCHTCAVSYGLGTATLAEETAELHLDRFAELLHWLE